MRSEIAKWIWFLCLVLVIMVVALEGKTPNASEIYFASSGLEMDNVNSKIERVVETPLFGVLISLALLAALIVGPWIFSENETAWLLLTLNIGTIIACSALVGFFVLLQQKSDLAKALALVSQVNQTYQNEMAAMLDTRLDSEELSEDEYEVRAEQLAQVVCGKIGEVIGTLNKSPVECSLLLVSDDPEIPDEVFLEMWVTTRSARAVEKIKVDDPSEPDTLLAEVLYSDDRYKWIDEKHVGDFSFWKLRGDTLIHTINYSIGDSDLILGLLVFEIGSSNRLANRYRRELTVKLAGGFSYQLYNFLSIINSQFSPPYHVNEK